MVLTLCTLPVWAFSDAKIKKARVLHHNGQHAKALEVFDEVLKGDADNIEALIGRVDALGAMKKLEELTVMKTSKRGADKDEALVEAQIFLWEKNLPMAIKTLTAHLAAHPNSYMGHYLLGSVYASTKQGKDRARTHLQKAIELNKDFPESYFALGDLHFKASESNKARELWNKYLALVPKEGKRYEYVSNTLARMGGY
jgi:tetratricopeptide (TPR) repeat protein